MRFGYALATFVCCHAPQVCSGGSSAMVKAKRLLKESDVATPSSQHHGLRGHSKEKTVNRLRASLLARKADIDLSSGPEVKEGHVNTGDEERDMPLEAVAPLNPSREDADMERELLPYEPLTCEERGYTSVDCVGGYVRDTSTPCATACTTCCQSFSACDGFTGEVCDDGNIIHGIKGSCSGVYACFYATIPHVVNSCKDEGDYACIQIGDASGSAGDIIDSCHGDQSCYTAGAAGSVGNIINSCVGNKACYRMGYQGGIGDIADSCNADQACKELAYNSVIGSDLNECCSTEGECAGYTIGTTLPAECTATTTTTTTTTTNFPPEVDPLEAMVVFVTDAPGAPVDNGHMSVSATDHEGDTLTYAWDVVGECPGASIDEDDPPDGVDPQYTPEATFIASAGTNPQVCEVKVTVCDDHDACASEKGIVTIVDPELEGFVTGGGFIQSPLGAYTADPSMTGKANFGFASKYKKGQSTPSGNTNFVFKAASLHFKSTSYEWLVVTGSDTARFKGVGLIEGNAEEHGFMLTACDNGEGEDDPPDTFRIKIWETSDGEPIIYDNKQGVSDASFEGTEISGGNIQIHQK